MIFEPTISKRQGGQILIRERQSFEDLVIGNGLGLFLMGVGCLIIYVFLSGGGPTPIGSLGNRIFGCIAIAFFVVVLGIWPLWWGLSELFVRRSFKVCPDKNVLEAHTAFAGATLRMRSYGFRAFKQIAIRQERHGVLFGARPYCIVSCEGGKRLDLSAFSDRTDAEAFAADLGAQLKCPVVVSQELQGPVPDVDN